MSDLWQPMESAPKDGTRVILYDARTLLAATCRWDAAENYWLSTNENRYYLSLYFTHWAPRPEPSL